MVMEGIVMPKRPGWDSRRRNRNIGTSKSGKGSDNKLTIPQAWLDDRCFHEKIINPIVFKREINGNQFIFIVEGTQVGFCHACTPHDIEFVLNLIPPEHLAEIKMIVLRQPKRKERILSSVWGRLLYWSDILRFSGPAIHIEAQRVNSVLKHSKSLSTDEALEIERLIRDGHNVRTNRRYHLISTSPDTVRRTQLYRTLPHEIGHYVDYLESVELASGNNDKEWSRLHDLYFTKPAKDKEDFAHRYATEFYEQQRKLNNLPFDRIYKPNLLIELNLEPSWFYTES